MTYNSNFIIKDYGPEPVAVNIDKATRMNNNFRIAIWTGLHLQMTLMSIDVNGEIGLEIHPDTDQFLKIEEGNGIIKMGSDKDNLNYEQKIIGGYGIFIPANTWHNLINIGNSLIKLYSIYAPPHHKKGTIHKTKAIADLEER